MRLRPLQHLLAGLSGSTPERDAPAPAADPAAAPGSLHVATDRLFDEDAEFNYSADVAYPQIEGGGPTIERVNAAIRDSVEAAAAYVRPDPTAFTGDPEQDRLLVGALEGGFTEPLLQDGLFSTRLDLSVYTGGAHPNHYALPLTYDLTTGAPVRLADLFRPDAAWRDTLARLATDRLVAARGSDWLFEVPIPAEALSTFTLGPDSLRLFFAPYAIAPYAAGTSEVALSYERLRDLLDPAGPTTRLLD
ncbi:MAG: DUF3298 domain-containing protein [Rhodothermales bacterium]|nr:DUF3298 domain-containing protein [Rhodothermales bacterium]